jgi:glycosyltransferase involved in cell wall biosynthesis
MSAEACGENSLVSVVIPSYNHEQYIRAAIESVLSQTYDNIELIIVDDGSSDNSLEIIREFEGLSIKVIEQKNRGAHNAINRGLDTAEGEYLAILNSDDVFHPDRLTQCVARLREGRAELVASYLEVIDQSGNTLGIKQGWKNMLPWDIPNYENTFASTDDFALNLLASNFVATTSNLVFTRRLYGELGGMRNLRFTHDWDFLLRAAAKFQCCLTPAPLVKYRIHDSNTISSNRPWMLFEICWVLAAGLRLFEGIRLYAGDSEDDWVADANLIRNSIQLQGNDKVFWMIRQFVNSQLAKGVEDADVLLLDNPNLRQPFIDAIVDIQNPPARADRKGGALATLLLNKLRLRRDSA